MSESSQGLFFACETVSLRSDAAEARVDPGLLPDDNVEGLDPVLAHDRRAGASHGRKPDRNQTYNKVMKRALPLLAVALLTVAACAQWSNPSAEIPDYNPGAPSHALPPILHGSQLTGVNFTRPFQVTASRMAAQVSPVLHQLPCYCRCDRSMGHNSLHSCFEGLHGAECSTCMKEAVFAYTETKRGRTPAQIRGEIERGDWVGADLEHASL